MYCFGCVNEVFFMALWLICIGSVRIKSASGVYIIHCLNVSKTLTLLPHVLL